MIALIDNYDSFTYNLFQYLGELGAEVRVWRNDAIGAGELLAHSPRAIVISPGPGRPESAGISKEVLAAAADKRIAVLGVCLGHQAIGECFGAKVIAAKHLMHGKTSPVEHDGKTIFEGLPSPMTVMRYHSLALAEDSIPDIFDISARGGGEIMAMRHKTLPMESVQFHPESIMTPEGKPLLQNFLRHYLGA